MYINDRSKEHSRTHNVMSKNIFNSILHDHKNLTRGVLRGSFYDIDKDEIEQISDEIERNIKLAIDLLDETPNRTFILTSDSLIDEYRKNPHFQDVKEIDVKSGKEALGIIDSYYNLCRYDAC